MATKRKPGLKKGNSESEYTAEQVDELIKCAKDPLYFINNYVYIKHAKRGKIKFKMYDYQEEIIRKYNSERFNIVLSARQTGKCFLKNTNISIIQQSNSLVKRFLLYILNKSLYNSLYKG